MILFLYLSPSLALAISVLAVLYEYDTHKWQKTSEFECVSVVCISSAFGKVCPNNIIVHKVGVEI